MVGGVEVEVEVVGIEGLGGGGVVVSVTQTFPRDKLFGFRSKIS